MTPPGPNISVFLIIFTIAIPTFFGVRWALNKIMKSNILLRKVLTWIGAIILTTIFCIGVVVLVIFYENYYPSGDFDASAWYAAREKRYEITGDLIKSGILIGKRKDEVQKILGKDFRRYSEDNDDRWVYDVGALPGFHLESDFLHIYFKSGKVEKVEQHGT